MARGLDVVERIATAAAAGSAGGAWSLTAVSRATTTLCLFRTPDEIAEPAHQRGEQLQAA